MDIQELFQSLIDKKTTRKFYVRVRDDHVLDENFSPRAFTRDESYFQVSLSEMFLEDRREYWQGFVPLGVIVSDFIYGGARQTVPFLVGNQILKGIEKYIEKEYVEYFNTRIVGPVPYMGDGVALFVGLFRSEVNNLAEKLFNVVEGLVGAFDVSRLSEYLEIAKPLGRGLSDLLGMQEVELRVGNRDVFNDKAGDPNQFKEGYLAYINCPAKKIVTGDLWVKDGRLVAGKDRESLDPFTAYDYCLVRLEHLSERNDYTTLPFHRRWETAQASIFDGNLARARSLLVDLVGQLAKSPDLTCEHRYHLMQVYKAQFEREVGFYSEVSGKGSEPGAVTSRGTGTGDSKEVLSPKASIQYAAQVAAKAGIPKDGVRGLLDISRNWESIFLLAQQPEKADLTDSVLGSQMRALQSMSSSTTRDPEALADAIIAGTMGSR
ncbi:MAG: hypothetical protein ABSG91_19145 [Syntrophobacteraceae bacterium]